MIVNSSPWKNSRECSRSTGPFLRKSLRAWLTIAAASLKAPSSSRILIALSGPRRGRRLLRSYRPTWGPKSESRPLGSGPVDQTESDRSRRLGRRQLLPLGGPPFTWNDGGLYGQGPDSRRTHATLAIWYYANIRPNVVAATSLFMSAPGGSRLSGITTLALPRRAPPRQGPPRPTQPCHAKHIYSLPAPLRRSHLALPRHAQPYRSMPDPAAPRHAALCLNYAATFKALIASASSLSNPSTSSVMFSPPL